MKVLNYLLITKPSRIVGAQMIFWIGLIYALFSTQIEFSIEAIVLQCFLFISFYGGIFIMNDLFDLKTDSLDPVQSKRKIASGAVPVSHAVIEMLVLLSVSLTVGFFINRVFFFLLLLFLVINILYSSLLKKFAYIDMIFISITAPLKFLAGFIILGGNFLLVTQLPLLLFWYFVNLYAHAEKQLVRVLQARFRTFLLGKYAVNGLLFLIWLAVCFQFVAIFFVSGLMQLSCVMVFALSFVTAYGISTNETYRNRRIKIESKVSKL